MFLIIVCFYQCNHYTSHNVAIIQSKHSQNKIKTDLPMDSIINKIEKTDEQWKKDLSPEQYKVLRKKGTERPFTGEYNLLDAQGTYYCAGCGAALFTSENKFLSNCGWPSFDKIIAEGTVKEVIDSSHNMIRVEVVCARCDGHLGHVFDDGPTETGMRYCINSVSLKFEKDNIK